MFVGMTLNDIKIGDRVCIAGRGTANLIHRHGTVNRLTKTMIIVAYTNNGAPAQRRYRSDGREVGASEYGGSHLDVKCQRPKKS